MKKMSNNDINVDKSNCAEYPAIRLAILSTYWGETLWSNEVIPIQQHSQHVHENIKLHVFYHINITAII
jgi:hypothetical protein